MDRTLADHFNLFTSHYPEALISEYSREEIRAIGRHFPFTLASVLAFESRLNRPESEVDFSFGIELPQRWWVLETGGAGKTPLWGHSLMQGILGVCREWAAPGTMFHRFLRSVWLEYDSGNPSVREGLPSLIYHPFCRAFRDTALFLREFEGYFNRLSGYYGHPLLSGATAGAFRRVVGSLPVGAELRTMGIPVRRETTAFRLGIRFSSPEPLFACMRNLGLEHFLPDIEETVSRLAACCDYLNLHLDLDEGIAEKIGIDFYARDYYTLHQRGWSRKALEYLYGSGYCNKEKYEALLQWPGWSREIFTPELANRLSSFCLSNFKLVYRPGEGPEVKGYFGIVDLELE